MNVNDFKKNGLLKYSTEYIIFFDNIHKNSSSQFVLSNLSLLLYYLKIGKLCLKYLGFILCHC